MAHAIDAKGGAFLGPASSLQRPQTNPELKSNSNKIKQ
ncbi:hypothetical protein SynA1560_00378 [Synechococcus sp. A15-60]|nr:hypothetical protein SynA1560_00378 [Synechococcus sp. A15-60]